MYRGLRVHKSSQGWILDVEVEGDFGVTLHFDPEDYRRRGIAPPIERLPCDDLVSNKTLPEGRER